jgi:hypothetical protein
VLRGYNRLEEIEHRVVTIDKPNQRLLPDGGAVDAL